jgi:hypothetical protein
MKLKTDDDILDRCIQDDAPSEQGLIWVYYINDNNVETCPQILLSVGTQNCRALTDTECQCSIISEELYNKFKARGLNSLELPTQNVVLKSAFTGRTRRVRKQALVTLQINNISMDQILLISPHLVTPLLLGMDFCIDNQVIDFPKRKINIRTDCKESTTTADLVNDRQDADDDIESPVNRVINPETAKLPPRPQLKYIVNPSITSHPTQRYDERIPEENPCPNRMTVEEATLCKEIYSLFRGSSEDIMNEGETKGVNNPYKPEAMNRVEAKGKNEHADANEKRRIEVRRVTRDIEEEIGWDGTILGGSKEGKIGKDDVKKAEKGEEDVKWSLEQLRIEKGLSYDRKM